ncbi:uncharacterized protein [Choristoneura fumiferana]|uniref:uncharacterized protein n=1 Tax=Choristoneura fumiferana TaxID=7141 RepID=UPI003D15E4C5
MVRTVLLFYVFVSLYFCSGLDKPSVEKKLYMAAERPVVTFINRNYISYANITSFRYGRRNPQYYVNLHMSTTFTVGNNVTVSFWFYEYYSSQYRRSFLEMSFKWCNLVYKDTFFGPALRRNLPKSCPHKPV